MPLAGADGDAAMADFPIQTKTLDNGLKVLVWEDSASACASVWLVFRVGSGHEHPGITGVSHWVEHMLFQGGIEFDKGEIFKAIARVGGYNNGFTSKNITAYFETLPAEHLDIGLRIEADRGLHSKFDPEETERERTVIISERQGYENYPDEVLDEEVDMAALRAHPYRWPVIGHMSDLKTMTRDDLYGYYQDHYVAPNAAVVVTGNVDAAHVFDRVTELFGDMSSSAGRHVFTEEPVQLGERIIELNKPGSTHYVEIAHHAPSAVSEDGPAMIVLDAILSGAKSFAMGGGSGGRTSRLYRKLVSSGLASRASSYYSLTPEPHVHKVYATVRQGVKAPKVEKALLRELAAMRDKGPSKSEVEKAKRQIAAALARGLDGTTNKAYFLARAEALGDYTLTSKLPAAVEKLTVEQVHEMAAKLFVNTNRTIGRMIPTGGAGGAGAPGNAAAWMPSVMTLEPDRPCAFYTPRAAASSGGGARKIPGMKREVLDNGIVLLTAPRKSSGLATVRACLGVGSNSEPGDKSGLAAFCASAAQRGTEKHSYRQIFERLDGVGASFGMWTSRHKLDFSGAGLSRDCAKILRTAGEVLTTAIFPEDEVERLRGEIITGLKEAEEDPSSVASRELRRAVFGADHPLGRRSSGEIDTVSAITRDDLSGWLKSVVSPAGMIVSVCGDMKHTQVRRLVDEVFGGWEGSAVTEADLPDVKPQTEKTRQDTVIEGKSQSDIALGFRAVPRKHPDYYAVAQATHILGQFGLMGRLGDRVRDAMGLAYYAYASGSQDPIGDLWQIRAGVNPENVGKALDAIEEELARMRTEEVTESEISDSQGNLVGAQGIRLETCSQVAEALHAVECQGLGLDYFDRYGDYVRAVSRADILEAASKHFPESAYSVTVAGPEAPKG